MATQQPDDIASLVEMGIHYQKEANWEFDLGTFRWHTAAMCKYMIRAREKVQRGFLGDAKGYTRWTLPNPVTDPHECRMLLVMANETAKLVWNDVLEMGGSGGVAADDPLGEFKSTVAGFLEHDSPALLRAIALAGEGKQQGIDWNSIANWGSLDLIRNVLDHLPEPSGRKSPATPFQPVPGESPTGKSQSSAADPKHDEPASDGPFTHDGFRYKGVEAKDLRPIPFRLLQFLWNTSGRDAEFQELAEPVWRDHALTVTEDRVGSARREINRFFEENGFALTVRTKTDPQDGRKYVVLSFLPTGDE